MLIFLEHDAAGAFAEHEAVAILVIGPRGGFGTIVETGRQRAAGGKAGDANAIDGRFGAAGDHHVGVAHRDDARRVADGVRAGGAGRHHRMIRALQAMHDGDIAGDEIDDSARDEERRDAARSLLPQGDGGFVNAAEAADAGADQHAGRFLLLWGVGHPAGVF